MTQIATVVRVGDRLIVEIHPVLAKVANITNGTLIEEQLTEHRLLLTRVDVNEKKMVVGPTPGRTSPTARYGGSTET